MFCEMGVLCWLLHLFKQTQSYSQVIVQSVCYFCCALKQNRNGKSRCAGTITETCTKATTRMERRQATDYARVGASRQTTPQCTWGSGSVGYDRGTASWTTYSQVHTSTNACIQLKLYSFLSVMIKERLYCDLNLIVLKMEV